jgi:pyrroloquinoline-quinone synthase
MSDPLRDRVEQIVAARNASANPYFRALEDGSFTRDDFVETQIQFYFAVVFFSRPMAALAAKIPHAEQRVEILRNVWEEHGEGRRSFMHGTTFLELLHRLGGITPQDVEDRALWPEVRAFNTVLVGACVLDEYLVGASVLGIIERLFADISTWIGRGIVRRGFLAESQLIHYDLHEKLDHRHSDDFFALLRPTYARGGQDAYVIEQGLELGAYVFLRLYDDLWRARTRRVSCAGHGNHGLHTRA